MTMTAVVKTRVPTSCGCVHAQPLYLFYILSDTKVDKDPLIINSQDAAVLLHNDYTELFVRRKEYLLIIDL